MAKFSSTLDHVKIAAPCAADWIRCSHSKASACDFALNVILNVYNLAGNDAERGRSATPSYRRPPLCEVLSSC
jgi:hypothetical protein